MKLLLLCAALACAVAFTTTHFTTDDRWGVVAKSCFGYTETPGSIVGAIQLDVLVPASGVVPTELVMLTFNDAEAMAAAAVDCEAQRAAAINHAEIGQLFTIAFDQNGRWRSPIIPITEQFRVREWYVVLAKACGADSSAGLDLELLPTFTHRGVYSAGTGPTQCAYDSEEFTNGEFTVQPRNPGVKAGLVVLSLLVCGLVVALVLQCKRTRALSTGYDAGGAMDEMDDMGDAATGATHGAAGGRPGQAKHHILRNQPTSDDM